MNKATARKAQEELIAEAWGLADAKRASYTQDREDVLYNFKAVAERASISKYQVWMVYAMKHMMSVESAIKANPAAPVDASESLRGRLVDLFNYVMLLVALAQEDGLIEVKKPDGA